MWKIHWEGLTFRLKTMGFKHTGIFPEQAVNWRVCHGEDPRGGPPPEDPVRVLNLFGYTGAATLACMKAGAMVTHVDASKGMVAVGQGERPGQLALADRPVRWLVDDCMKFVQREQRRGRTYDGIIMDPPSYGRGPGGEVWKLEEQLYGLIEHVRAHFEREPPVLHSELLHHRAVPLGDGVSAGGAAAKAVWRQGQLGRDRPAGDQHRPGAALRKYGDLRSLRGPVPGAWPRRTSRGP